MSVVFNHTIVHCSDKQASATFLCQILGLPDPTPYSPFLEVHATSGVSLGYADGNGVPSRQHYAFLANDDDCEAITLASSSAA